MKIRTVSDLTQLQGVPTDNDLIEISHMVGDGKFSSRKYTYAQLEQNMQQAAEDSVGERWNIKNVADLKPTVDFANQLKARVTAQSDGTLQFNKAPSLKNVNGEDGKFQTKQQVKELAQQYSAYITPDSFVSDCQPENDSGFTNEYQYMWKIENGQYDSSLAYDEDGFQMGGIRIKKTGYLTIYGWLASNSQVLPQNAWVGLYGLFADKWILVQVQPWIIGQNSELLQYVGFNIPVKEGLTLKIKTGFPVNGANSGFHTYSNTLLLSNKGNTANTFVGYVIEN